MLIEYNHGQRVTPHIWELSTLDCSITDYEKKARSYHYNRKRKVLNETPEQREQRLGQLKGDLVHLKNERKRIACMAQVNDKLEKYRNEYKNMPGRTRAQSRAKFTAYKNEAHHPTEVLEDHLRFVGRGQPSPRHTAHHLVEGKGKLPITADERLLLFMNDIRINDPDNGVWMPSDVADEGHWSMPRCPAHRRIHTHNYERWVHGQIEFLDNEQAIRDKLTIMRSQIKDCKLPEKVLQKPDKSWDGRS